MKLNTRMEAFQRERDKARSENSHGYVMAAYMPITGKVILSRTVDPARWEYTQNTRYGERIEVLLKMHTGRSKTILSAIKAAFEDYRSSRSLFNIPRSDWDFFSLLSDEIPEPNAVPKRKESRKQRRVSLSVQLVEGEDDDLIEWRDELPEGGIQAAVKQVLREQLFGEESLPTSTYSRTVLPRDDEMHQKLDWLHAMLSEGSFLENILANQMQTAVQQGIKSLEGVTFMGSSTLPPDGIMEEVQEDVVTDEEAEEYEQRLKDMPW